MRANGRDEYRESITAKQMILPPGKCPLNLSSPRWGEEKGGWKAFL